MREIFNHQNKWLSFLLVVLSRIVGVVPLDAYFIASQAFHDIQVHGLGTQIQLKFILDFAINADFQTDTPVVAKCPFPRIILPGCPLCLPATDKNECLSTRPLNVCL